MSNFPLTSVGVAVLILVATVSSWADVRLPSLVSEGMVIQRGAPVRIQGWAEDGEKVTVTFRGQSASSVAKDGKWSVALKPMKAGGPFPMKIAGKNTIEFTDIMVGDVWVCSGQSNMAWTLSQIDAKDDIAKSANPNIRLFHVPTVSARRPQDNVQSSWKTCTPDAASEFSAVAYYFGRSLQKSLNVPIGLINSSWGGSPIEPWTRASYYAASPELKQVIGPISTRGEIAGWPAGGLYNGMIAPLVWYPIKGAIWYQGESNCGRGGDYVKLLPAMIRNWRDDWGIGDFSFLIVQLAPFGDPPSQSGIWAEVREAQLLATLNMPKVGLAVTTDVGDRRNIHPPKKVPVGERLALAARAIGHGEKIEYSGPLYKSMKVDGDKIILRFTHVGKGLMSEGGELKGFEIAGQDGQFVPASAAIKGDTVVVSSKQIQKPTAARYGWVNYPEVNLFNKNGLPASPFRTNPEIPKQLHNGG